MTELELTADVETEEFTDELSDDPLDRAGGWKASMLCYCPSAGHCG
jgi:hypothetical protein